MASKFHPMIQALKIISAPIFLQPCLLIWCKTHLNRKLLKGWRWLSRGAPVSKWKPTECGNLWTIVPTSWAKLLLPSDYVGDLHSRSNLTSCHHPMQNPGFSMAMLPSNICILLEARQFLLFSSLLHLYGFLRSGLIKHQYLPGTDFWRLYLRVSSWWQGWVLVIGTHSHLKNK